MGLEPVHRTRRSEETFDGLDIFSSTDSTLTAQYFDWVLVQMSFIRVMAGDLHQTIVHLIHNRTAYLHLPPHQVLS
jgi:hypothetical protein